MTNEAPRIVILTLASSLFFAACGGGLPYPGLTIDEVYALGLQAREQEEWQEAVDAFEYVIFSQGFNRVAEARLLLAEAHYMDGAYIEARSEYQRVIDRWPADTVAVTAALGVCRSLAGLSPITQRDQSYTRQARLSCRQVAADFAGTVMGLEAGQLADEMMLKLAERDYDTGLHYLKRGLFDSALLYFEQVADEFSETEWAPWALYQMVDVFGRIGYLRDVETTRDLLLQTYPDSEPAQLLLDDGGV
jgi:outer membrane protein assembly factor BamD